MREDRLRNISLCAALAAVRSASATAQDKLAPFFEAISLFMIILLTFGAVGLPAQGQLNLSPSTLNLELSLWGHRARSASRSQIPLLPRSYSPENDGTALHSIWPGEPGTQAETKTADYDLDRLEKTDQVASWPFARSTSTASWRLAASTCRMTRRKWFFTVN